MPPDKPGPPRETPIGLLTTQVGRSLEQAFDGALTTSGGSRPRWLILLAVISGAAPTQAALATHLQITGATLVHHLDRMEAEGLLVRTAVPDNRRVRALELTDAGRAAFLGMREAALGFDAQLREGFTDRELTTLRRLLGRLRANVSDDDKTPRSDS